VERQRSSELRLATLAEQEADAARVAQVEAWRDEVAGGRAAVLRGNAEGRMLAEVSMELRAQDARRLATLQAAREILRETAWQTYRQSRVQTEQMQRTAERLRAEAAEQEAHRRSQSRTTALVPGVRGHAEVKRALVDCRPLDERQLIEPRRCLVSRVQHPLQERHTAWSNGHNPRGQQRTP
jgi:hypothetical protein